MLSRLKLAIGVLLLSFITILSAPALADALSVAQSYSTSSSIQPGTIVQLVPNNANAVEPLEQKNDGKMFGVAINPNNSPVTLSAPSSNQVFVATNGNYQVLVSNQNGPIKIGDYVTISSLDGIGMKASGSDAYVLGKATAAFSGTNDSIGTASLKNSSGQKIAVALGQISVAINITRNPLMQPAHSSLPSFLRSAAQSIGGKSISAARAYLSLAILLISAVIAGSLLYAGVRNGMISLGRNPLSKKSITRGLIQVTITSLIVFIAGLFAVYLLVRF